MINLFKWCILIISAIPIMAQSSVSGLIFYGLNINDEKISSFEIGRASLTYEAEVNPALKVKIQTDVGRQKNDSDNPQLVLFLKNAKLDWKNRYGTLIIGLQGSNIFKIQEGNWGHRFIEKSAMDLFHIANSADQGIGWYFTGRRLKGSLLISNGSGYKKPENDKYKLVSLQLYTGMKKLKSQGFNGGAVLTNEGYDVDSVTVGNKSILGIFGGLAGKSFRIGAEYDYYDDSQNSHDFSIISVYGTYKFSKNNEIFMRADQTTNELEDGKYILGLNLNPATGIKIAPNLRYTFDKDENSLEYGLNFEFKF